MSTIPVKRRTQAGLFTPLENGNWEWYNYFPVHIFPAAVIDLAEKMPEVQIYTDGACSGNPGPGGYGAILKYGNYTREISGGYRMTTNNRMELMGIIKSLEEIKRPCIIQLFSDSRYIVDALNLGWVDNWVRSGWLKSDGSPVKNVDLWKRLLTLAGPHRISWIWVKGHSGNELNSRCDHLAVKASREDGLAADTVFESGR